MRLRKPCEHGHYDPHVTPWVRGDRKSGDPGIYDDCPGGEFLAEDTPIRVWWCANHNLVGGLWCAMRDKAAGPCHMVEAWIVLDALSVQEADR